MNADKAAVESNLALKEDEVCLLCHAVLCCQGFIARTGCVMHGPATVVPCAASCSLQPNLSNLLTCCIVVCVSDGAELLQQYWST